MIAIVDADSIVYRIGYSTEDAEEDVAVSKTSSFLREMLYVELNVDTYYGYLTGKTNYRSSIATTAPYKGNRKGDKPKHYQAIRDHLCSAWSFTIEEGQEADDAVAIKATELAKNNDKFIICHIDKDIDQVPGLHFNFTTFEQYEVSEEEARLNFWMQVLTGDKIDNIIGIHGIGPVKAKKLLKDCKADIEFYNACIKAYEGVVERVNENCSLLWLRREPEQMWEPPK